MIGASHRVGMLIVLATVISLSGCGHFHHRDNIGSNRISTPILSTATVHLVDLSLSGLAEPASVRSATKTRLLDTTVGQAITPEWCASRAAQVCAAASLAGFETKVGSNPLETLATPNHAKSDRLQKSILDQAAWEARSKQTAAALEMLFRLAEVQGKRALLATCLDDVEIAFADAERIRDKGFTADTEPLRSRRDEIWQSALKLDAAEAGLSAQLRALLKLDCDCNDGRLVAVVDWNLLQELGSSECRSCEAVNAHPELRFLADLESSVDSDTLPVVRRYLRSVQPLLGATAAIPGLNIFQRVVLMLFTPPVVKREIDVRRRQIASYRDDRAGQLTADQEARSAEIRSLQNRVSLERESLAAGSKRFEQTAGRNRDGVASRIELALAKLALADIEQRIVGLLADAMVAEVKLRQARGELVETQTNPTCSKSKGNRRGLLATDDNYDCKASGKVETIDE